MILGGKGVGGYLHPDLLWLLKSELEISISNQMRPFRSLYEHTFLKKHICPQYITCNTCPQALGVWANIGVLLYDPWTIFNKQLSQDFIGYIWEKERGKGGGGG